MQIIIKPVSDPKTAKAGKQSGAKGDKGNDFTQALSGALGQDEPMTQKEESKPAQASAENGKPAEEKSGGQDQTKDESVIQILLPYFLMQQAASSPEPAVSPANSSLKTPGPAFSADPQSLPAAGLTAQYAAGNAVSASADFTGISPAGTGSPFFRRMTDLSGIKPAMPHNGKTDSPETAAAENPADLSLTPPGTEPNASGIAASGPPAAPIGTEKGNSFTVYGNSVRPSTNPETTIRQQRDQRQNAQTGSVSTADAHIPDPSEFQRVFAQNARYPQLSSDSRIPARPEQQQASGLTAQPAGNTGNAPAAETDRTGVQTSFPAVLQQANAAANPQPNNPGKTQEPRTQTDPAAAVASTGKAAQKEPAREQQQGASGESSKQDSRGGAQTDQPVFPTMGLHNTAAAGPASEPSEQINAKDIARQLTDAFKTASDTGKSQIRIHLSPEDLGGINIKIVSDSGSLSLQITADHRHTGELLASNLGDLTRSMNESGVNMRHIEIMGSMTGSFSSQTGTPEGRQEPSGGKAQFSPAVQKAPEEEEAVTGRESAISLYA